MQVKPITYLILTSKLNDVRIDRGLLDTLFYLIMAIVFFTYMSKEQMLYSLMVESVKKFDHLIISKMSPFTVNSSFQ